MSTNEAGPSTGPGTASSPRTIRKPRAPHPAHLVSNEKRTKLPPALPAKRATSSHPSASVHPRGKHPTLPLKTLQGISKTRTDGTKDGYGREIIFVTRKTGLGMLMGRCRSLVVDEGYTRLTLHALGAAIPQALLLLHALLDLLPYPVGEKGMWYEIQTGSVECMDEVEKGAEKDAAAGDGVGSDEAWLQDIGAVEADIPKRQSRIKSSITIDLHISPKPKPKGQANSTVEVERKKRKAGTRNRPSKKRRHVLSLKKRQAGDGGEDRDEDEDMDEEEALNLRNLQNQAGVGEESMMDVQPSGTTLSEEEEIEEIE